MHTNKDEAKLYEALDLAEVDKLFSAYQKNGMLFFFTDFLFSHKSFDNLKNATSYFRLG